MESGPELVHVEPGRYVGPIAGALPLYPVPPLADLNWLVGDRLDVVSTAEFTIWFAFDSKGVVQADEPVELIDRDGRSEVYNPQTREGSWPFRNIVGCKVDDVARPDDWTIEIGFENGFRLITTSTDGGFESGRVAVPGRDGQRRHQF